MTRLTREVEDLTCALPVGGLEGPDHATATNPGRRPAPLNPSAPRALECARLVVPPKSQSKSMIHPKPHAAPAAPSLAVERPEDAALADALIERAFGPGRLTKVSERVREFAAYAPQLSFCAWRGERLAGVVRQWRVRCGETPVVFLGPIAVEADERSGGVGGLLVAAAVEAAKAAGETAIVLVGDVPFFGRHGFSVAKDVELPGPVDPKRVLSVALKAEGEQLSGMVRPLRV
jgi:predicted N-acetyltransferase YhbS